MSLLTMVQDAALLAGVAPPSAVMATTDIGSRQWVALAQFEGEDLSRAHDWRRLKVSATITGDGATEFWALPGDWDRQMAGDNLWLQSAPFIPLTGPLSDQDFLAMKAAPTRPMRPIWRYFGDELQIWPVLTSGQICTLEYRSSHWISSSDGTTIRNRWLQDDDVAMIPERVMALGLVWRWKQSKGLDYAEAYNSYQLERTKAARNDDGYRTLKSAELFNRDALTGRKNLYSVVVST